MKKVFFNNDASSFDPQNIFISVGPCGLFLTSTARQRDRSGDINKNRAEDINLRTVQVVSLRVRMFRCRSFIFSVIPRCARFVSNQVITLINLTAVHKPYCVFLPRPTSTCTEQLDYVQSFVTYDSKHETKLKYE